MLDYHIMSDTSPITLHMDASDHVQTVNGTDQPVTFVSKSLNKSQLR